jgi:hypothetical protein
MQLDAAVQIRVTSSGRFLQALPRLIGSGGRKGVRNRFLIFGERFDTLGGWEEPNVRLMVA